MNSQNNMPVDQIRERAHERVWIRHDYPTQPFFWRAFLLLFAFLLLIGYSLIRFAPNIIQESKWDATAPEFRSQCFDGAEVSVFNRRAIHSGRPQNLTAGNAVVIAQRRSPRPHISRNDDSRLSLNVGAS